MKYFNVFISSIVLFACFINVNSQDYPPSVGPAPYVYNRIPESSLFTDAVGTRCFTQISSTPTFQFGKVFLEGCSPTNIGAPFTITFPGGLLTRNGVVYTWNQSSPYQLWSIDTVTGVHTLVFNMTGIPLANLTGMVWDGTTMYGLATSITQSQIVTFNMTTGVCTPVGTASAVCAGGIELFGRQGAQYSLFATDIVADNLYKINKTTGAFTLVGPLGQNINFGQGGTVDPNDNTFYTCCYTAGPELRKIDTVTGALGPILCTYTAQATGLAAVNFAFPPPPGLQITYCRNNGTLNISDNSTVRDTLRVFGWSSFLIFDVNIRIDTLVHTWVSDLAISITHNATTVALVTNRGGSGDNFIGTILNDSAANPISGGTAPFTGSFRPESPLAPFNSQDPNGNWVLTITDNAVGDTGVLRAWCIVVSIRYVGGIQTIEIPNYYFLNQNYPNPFNPVTNIKFGIPESGDVRIVVYDVLGREVKTLMNEFKNPGTYEVQFDATELASGIYFYSLQTFRGIETKKMLIVK
jgi:subtilisin-like proprotein convertase family protein